MKLYTKIQHIVDMFFPLSNDARIVREVSDEDMQMVYEYRSIHGIHTLSQFAEKHIRALVHEAKFHGSTHAQVLLHSFIVRHLSEQNLCPDVIIPIPLSNARYRERGYNQVEKILNAGNMHYPVLTNVLVRTHDTKPQTKLARGDRLTNVHGAFGVVNGERIIGKHILLVDDVMTTGATLREAKAILLLHDPASIMLLALAH